MFERPGGGEKAVLVQLDFGQGDVPERLDELKLLAASAGAAAVAVVQGRRERPDPALYAGKGKVAEVAEAIRAAAADLAIFNHELSAAQQRNLEKELGCRVVDRASLILDIFAQRALGRRPRGIKRRHGPHAVVRQAFHHFHPADDPKNIAQAADGGPEAELLHVRQGRIVVAVAVVAGFLALFIVSHGLEVACEIKLVSVSEIAQAIFRAK